MSVATEQLESEHGDARGPAAEGAVQTVLLTDTTRWALPARLAIGLSEVGCSVVAVCPTRHPLLKTRALRQAFLYSAFRPLESLLAAIEATNPQIVIPCDDRATQHLHQLHAQMRGSGQSVRKVSALIERSLGSPESYPIVSSRYELLRIAREEGLRVPETKQVNTVEDLRAWQAEQPLPWVLKVDGTYGGRGVRIADTAAQVARSFRDVTRLFGFVRAVKRLCVNRDPFWLGSWWNRASRASRACPTVIVQSYVRGRPANCTFLGWQGRVLAATGVEVLSAAGPTGPASVIRVVDSPEMKMCAERIAARLVLSGFFGLDFMIEESTGATYLIEMNPRCAPPCHLHLGTGRDLLGALAAQLSGKPLREAWPITQNDLIYYFPQCRMSKPDFQDSRFHDVPLGEADLVRELLRPWPDRSLFFRFFKFLQSAKFPTSMTVASKSSSVGGL